eukprot:3596563-Pyramimonas_sp.AAC.1
MCCTKRERLGGWFASLVLTEKHQHVADTHTMSRLNYQSASPGVYYGVLSAPSPLLAQEDP